MTSIASLSPVYTSVPRVVVSPKIVTDPARWLKYQVCIEVAIGGVTSYTDKDTCRKFFTRRSAELYARWIAWTMARELERWKSLLRIDFEITVTDTRKAKTHESATATRGPQHEFTRRMHQLQSNHLQRR